MDDYGLRIKISSVILGSLCVIILIYIGAMGYIILTNYYNFITSFSHPSYVKNWFDIRTYGGGAMVISSLLLIFLGTPLLFMGRQNTFNRCLLPSSANTNPVRYHKFKVLNICVVIGTFISILIGLLFLLVVPLLFQKPV